MSTTQTERQPGSYALGYTPEEYGRPLLWPLLIGAWKRKERA